MEPESLNYQRFIGLLAGRDRNMKSGIIIIAAIVFVAGVYSLTVEHGRLFPAQTKKEITDGAQLDEFVAITSRLADKGDMMIKMGDVPLLHVILYYPDQKLYFTFYQSRVKTPDTSFYANSPQNEKDLHEFLFSLLNK